MGNLVKYLTTGLGGTSQNLRYQQKIINMFGSSLLVYYPLWDLAGVTAEDISGNGRNGTYRNTAGVLNGVTLGQPSIGDGKTAAVFNGTSGNANIYTAGLAAAFSGDAGTAMCWLKMSGAGVWTDGQNRYMLTLQADTNNYLRIHKSSVNNLISLKRKGGGTEKSIDITTSSTAWVHAAITWSVSPNELKVYFGGAQSGVTQTGNLAWAGSLASNAALIGSFSGDILCHSGALAHALVLNRVATPAEIAAVVAGYPK
jgi:hypothetical protein